jgi:TolB-like protein
MTAWLTSRDPASAGPITLAVLPFGNIGADTAMTSVAPGLADEVASALARVPGIQIKSRIGAQGYAGQLVIDLAEAGARLKATYLLTGVMREERDRWILSLDVARAADGTSLWGEAFNISPEQVSGAAEAIAGRVVPALRDLFPLAIGSAPALAANTKTANPEAYRLYLRGQEKLSRRAQDVAESVELFRGAIHEDTLYAPAYSGLSMALALSPYFRTVPPDVVHDDVVSAARRALEIDTALALPHVALGLAFQHDYQGDSAATEFRRAIRLEDRNVEARVQYARHLLFRGRHAEALSQLRRARAEDPASALVMSWMSYAYHLDGQADSALTESKRALENDSMNTTSVTLGALVQLSNKNPGEAR